MCRNMCIDFYSNEILPSPGPYDSFVPFACESSPVPGLMTFVSSHPRYSATRRDAKQNKTMRRDATACLLCDASQAASLPPPIFLFSEQRRIIIETPSITRIPNDDIIATASTADVDIIATACT